MGAPAPGEQGRGRWSRACLIAGIVHVGLLAGGIASAGANPRVLRTPEPEPELVLLAYAAPPPAAAGVPTATRSAPVTQVQRKAPVQTPRLKEPTPTPVEAPVEKVEPTPVETAPEPEPESAPVAATADASASTGAVAGVVGGGVGGVVGGAVEGREGGALGAVGGDALTLKQVSRPPVVLTQVAPQYPRRAKDERVTGLVLVRVIIGTDGKVEPEHTRVMRSVAGLDEAAVAAVSQWRFSPALGREGRPVRVIVDIPMNFTLK
ncbi:TonB family protein [Corallococcus sp. M34]|nr:TonB family protein [Citreicoccus inhibens]